MLLAAAGIAPRGATAGRVLVDIFLVLTVLLGGWFTGYWIYDSPNLDRLHPGYFLPTVAGGLVASDSAAVVGQRLLAEMMLGLGLVCWFILGSIILARLFFRPALPAALAPTMAIEIALAAVASIAYFALRPGRTDIFAAALAGYGLLMVLAQLPLLPTYLRLRFAVSTWAFTFAFAAVASTALLWIRRHAPRWAPRLQLPGPGGNQRVHRRDRCPDRTRYQPPRGHPCHHGSFPAVGRPPPGCSHAIGSSMAAGPGEAHCSQPGSSRCRYPGVRVAAGNDDCSPYARNPLEHGHRQGRRDGRRRNTRRGCPDEGSKP